ncbi:MAG TPA: glycosyltransferase family 4 protein [Gemmatimonadaceae bacterium]|jgi:glycosyltransferase involved in cell wall biosynthesis|nr:glycosyltransferase family 4 protein [Gemmatimonadaceae bacterium]
MTPSLSESTARQTDRQALIQASPIGPGTGARIVLYTSSDCWRGAGISYLEIAAALDSCGFAPQVVATNPAVADEFSSAGLRPTLLSPGRGESARLRAHLRAQDVDLLIVDRAHDLRVAALSTLGTRIPVIFRYNHFRNRPPTDALIRVAYRTTLREQVFLSSRARVGVLAQTPFMRRVAATTIHEGVDSAAFRPNRRAAAEFRRSAGVGGAPFLLAVGALSREKRYEVLFDALRLLRHTAPRLVIFGEGPQERELRARAAQLRIDVTFLGRVPRLQLVGAYSACSAFVHPGCVETFGLAVLEAMACARPVIASAGGALPEVIGRDGTCGTLVVPNSAWDLAGTIARVISEPDNATRQGVRARERASHQFSVASMRRGYAQLAARHIRYRPITGA